MIMSVPCSADRVIEALGGCLRSASSAPIGALAVLGGNFLVLAGVLIFMAVQKKGNQTRAAALESTLKEDADGSGTDERSVKGAEQASLPAAPASWRSACALSSTGRRACAAMAPLCRMRRGDRADRDDRDRPSRLRHKPRRTAPVTLDDLVAELHALRKECQEGRGQDPL